MQYGSAMAEKAYSSPLPDGRAPGKISEYLITLGKECMDYDETEGGHVSHPGGYD